MSDYQDLLRLVELTERVKKRLDFSLCGLTVLTEVGSNFYIFTPLIPLLCGADYVYGFVKDTPYGCASEIKSKCIEFASILGLQNRLEIGINELENNWICKADIITNSGMLRPFNDGKINYFKKGAVFSLMFEAWELREEDLDLNFIKKKGIKVAGTWENHPDLKVFDYVEVLCLKMAFEAGFEVKGNNIFIWSDDQFGVKISQAFIQNGANICLLSIDIEKLFCYASSLDFIFLADYDEARNFFELLQIEQLVLINPRIAIIHLYGKVNIEEFENLNVAVYPLKNGKPRLMTYTLAHVGLTPLVNLHVGGYKVAYCLKNGIENQIVQKL